MGYLAAVFEAIIALKERNVSCTLPSLAKVLLSENRPTNKSGSKAFFSQAYQHLWKALDDGLANGSLVKAVGGRRDGHGHGRGGRFDPAGRLLRAVLIRARVSRKVKPTARRSTKSKKNTNTRKVAAPRKKKPVVYRTISSLMEVVRVLKNAGGTARKRAAYPKTAPSRKRKLTSSSSRFAVGVAPTAKKKLAAAAKKKKNRKLAATKSKAVVQKPKKAVTAAARKRTVTKYKSGVTPKTSRMRAPAKKK